MACEMEPRVTKRDRKVYLTYELPHRIHCSQVCPTLAPNGSTIIVYGHQRGIKILWRGGRRRRAAPAQTNGVSKKKQPEVIVIDDSDEEEEAKPDTNEYEDDEPEQDPDCPYSGIIHDLDIELDSAALHVAVPATPTSDAPALTKTHMLVAVACASGTVKLLSIPLAPPRDEEDAPSGLSQVDLPPLRQPARALTAKILPLDEEQAPRTRSKNRGTPPQAEVLIATVSSTLSISAVDVTATAIRKRHEPTLCSANLPSPATSVRFHPSRSSTQLLITDAAGGARIYDPHALESADGRPVGKWTMSYLAPFHASTTQNVGLERRKRILDGTWVLGGRCILVLLEDGEWGVWDTSGPAQSGKRVNEFTISGFLGSVGEVAEQPAAGSKKGTKLAPMTPNTRKTKSETLFGSSTSKVPGAASTGGISTTKTGHADESLVLWYTDEIYAIPSMQQFFQRSTGNSSSFGSLYAPGLAHIRDLNLLNEKITSIQLLTGAQQASNFGPMNTQRDMVVCAEHRMLITEAIKTGTPSRQLFQQAAERPVSRGRDQRMLDVGDLDLGGLNRMLDHQDSGRPRKVGFAAETT